MRYKKDGDWVVVSSFLKVGLLAGEPALEAPATLLAETAAGCFIAEAGRGLERNGVVDAGVVGIAVIPGKVFCEVMTGNGAPTTNRDRTAGRWDN